MAHVDPRLGPLVRTRASTSRAGAHRAPQQREEAVDGGVTARRSTPEP
jgi:hypothetical protein